ncbi:SDR family oxidoreductase [Rhizobium sp. C1]|uniref:SDR family oxidoreductase n=1 Tax=Rhizobium sp. C1 TaxID=1349799 RepID=UPI001E60C1AB|nr:SDR family oxidoreductase [Rhizobium sp. C1]MCD2178143.1 SDR family oxidoreductase [Rhizobium sp. C1]
MNEHFPRPPFPKQQQAVPGKTDAMQPRPDHGEESYVGSGRLQGKRALITGGDSGIGRAVAIAFAREGADVAICYLNEDEDAESTRKLIEAEGRACETIRIDVSKADNCRQLIDKVVQSFGGLDILVNNAAHQMTFDTLEDISDAEWDLTLATNISSMFYLSKAALPHLGEGGTIINTASINSDNPKPTLLAYATTKGAVQNFTAGLAQLLGKKNIRVNCVAPGPVWTPLIPSTMPAETVAHFGANTPMGRPAQPRELAPIYVMLASDEASYVSGATVAATGGKPMI